MHKVAVAVAERHLLPAHQQCREHLRFPAAQLRLPQDKVVGLLAALPQEALAGLRL